MKFSVLSQQPRQLLIEMMGQFRGRSTKNTNGSGLIVVNGPRAVPLAYNSFRKIKITNSDKQPTPIIVLHGLYGSRKQFRELARRLHESGNRQRKVFVLDARNHGESPHTAGHSLDEQTEDIVNFMQSHSISRSVLIGHSMGARAAMAVALKYVRNAPKPSVIFNNCNISAWSYRPMCPGGRRCITTSRTRNDQYIFRCIAHRFRSGQSKLG